jgi:hypothetical protein
LDIRVLALSSCHKKELFQVLAPGTLPGLDRGVQMNLKILAVATPIAFKCGHLTKIVLSPRSNDPALRGIIRYHDHAPS